MNYKIVSMFTKDTPYQDEAKKLLTSILRFKLDYKIYEIENTGSWEKNCQEKSKVILDALNSFEKDIVWVDADAVILQEPKLFGNINEDLCLYRTFRTDKECRHDVLSGTVFFKNNDLVKKLVQDWIDLNSSNSEFDQLNLRNTIDSEKYKDTITVKMLPRDYIRITSYDKNTVIVHNQASRRFKEIVGK